MPYTRLRLVCNWGAPLPAKTQPRPCEDKSNDWQWAQDGAAGGWPLGLKLGASGTGGNNISDTTMFVYHRVESTIVVFVHPCYNKESTSRQILCFLPCPM